MRHRTRLLLAATATAVGATSLVPTLASPSGPAFSAPVKVTPDLGYGFEPSVYPDRYGNLFVTAHKENVTQITVAPDQRNPTLTRSMSWAWYSADNGENWDNLPTGPMGTDAASHNFGDEGDFALDDVGNLYYVDINVVDTTFTSWSVNGLGNVEYRSHLPSIVTGEWSDDRPWIAAHLDGHLFYFANNGGKGEYTGNSGPDYGSGTGPGRYTVYSSYDGGATWDHVGTTLADSGWCRPAAASGSPYVYALCGNDEGTMYSYVSADDGRTWSRYTVGPYADAEAGTGWWTYPTLQVLPDGTLWGFYLDPRDFQPGPEPYPGVSGSLMAHHAKFFAYRSTDHGQTWTRYDISPNIDQQYMYGWMSATSDGKRLGYATYGRPNDQAPWKVYATTFKVGQKPLLRSIDDANPVTVDGYWTPPPDFLMAAFDRDNHLNVVWTRAVIQHGQFVSELSFAPTIADDVYFARSQ